MTKQLVIQNEKQHISGIVRALNKEAHSKKGYVNDVIDVGEKLNNFKEIVPFGQWESRVKEISNLASESGFGASQATRYMKIATNKLFVIEYINGEQSLQVITKLISEASPEQLEKVEQLKAAAEQKRITSEAEKAAKAEAKIMPEIIEGEFTEVKAPEPAAEKHEKINIEPAEDPFEVMQETIDMLSKDNAALTEEIDSVAKIFEANDQLVTAHAEVKKLQELNRVLKESLNGSMNSENAAKRSAKQWKAKYERLAKEVGREC